MIDPHPGSLYIYNKGWRLGYPALTSLTLTALQRHTVVASASLHAFIFCDLTLKAFKTTVSYLKSLVIHFLAGVATTILITKIAVTQQQQRLCNKG